MDWRGVATLIGFPLMLIGFPLIKSATFLARMSKYQFPASPRLGTHALPEFLCLHLDCIHVETGNVDVARVQTVWRQTAWFKAGTAVVQFIAAPEPHPFMSFDRPLLRLAR